MFTGLGPILFAVSIDKPELNNGENTLYKLKSHTEPIIITGKTPLSGIYIPYKYNLNIYFAESKGELKKKKRAPAHIISFDDEEEDNKSCLSYTSGSSISQGKSEKNIPAALSPENKLKPDETSGNNTNPKKKNYIAECFSDVSKQTNRDTQETCDATMTPVQHSQLGELVFVATDIEQYGSESPGSTDDGTIEIPTDIVAVLTTVENKNKEERGQLMERISKLTSDNENLKMRLKKYISAVQMLKTDGNIAHKALADLSFSEESVDGEIDHLDEVKLYEEKLVQVSHF